MPSLSYIRALAVVIAVCVPSGAIAQTASKDVQPAVVFQHLDGKPKIYSLDLNHGERFVVRIDRTCVDAFDYSYAGIERGIREQSERSVKAQLGAKDLSIVHDQQYGGYVVHVTAKPGVNAATECTDGDRLVATSFIISVNQRSWNLSFSGGFTVSGLTDPEFSVVTTNGTKNVVREREKEGSHKLGAASFVHLFNDNLQWKQLQPALGFGLGINNNNRTEYMIGAGLRFGDKATFNVGRVWGAIDRLPNGITFDTPITDDNVLANKGTQVVSRWFFALTYSFIDTKDRLTKPFAPDTGQAATPASPRTANVLPDRASLVALQEAAKSTATYKTIPEIAGIVQKGICDATTTADASKTVINVTVRGASASEIGTMQSKSPAALTAITATAEAALKSDQKLAVTPTDVRFEACQ